MSANALFHYELPFDKEYLPLINDLIRMAYYSVTLIITLFRILMPTFFFRFYPNAALFF